MGMSHKNHRAHKDRNHGEIVRDLEAIGCKVMDISGAGGALDLLTFLRDAVLLEIKVEVDAVILITQLETMANWPGFVAYVKNSEQAIYAVRDPRGYCWTKVDKEWALGFVYRWKAAGKGKMVTAKAFERCWKARKI